MAFCFNDLACLFISVIIAKWIEFYFVLNISSKVGCVAFGAINTPIWGESSFGEPVSRFVICLHIPGVLIDFYVMRNHYDQGLRCTGIRNGGRILHCPRCTIFCHVNDQMAAVQELPWAKSRRPPPQNFPFTLLSTHDWWNRITIRSCYVYTHVVKSKSWDFLSKIGHADDVIALKLFYSAWTCYWHHNWL